ncbi:MAG: DUF1566 domain-containing protein [Pseudomonadales bacterium]|nr:DUF1566 domain-containing protein [Pseudomonadales bacterium]
MKRYLSLLLCASYIVSGCNDNIEISKDVTPPVLSDPSTIGISRTSKPTFSFTSNEVGNISLSGACNVGKELAVVGINTIRFNAMPNGSYSDCSVQVEDNNGNISEPLYLASFSVQWLTKPLNDTGVISCGDYSWIDDTPGYEITSASGSSTNTLNCAHIPSPVTVESNGYEADGDLVPMGQDALFGRDASINEESDGHAGFDFSRLDVNGQEIAIDCDIYDAIAQGGDDSGVLSQAEAQNCYSVSPWACVRDNVTGLLWEVKTNSGLHKKDYQYAWYNSTGLNDGGHEGYDDVASDNGRDNCHDGSRCDSEKFVEDVNTQTLCGSNDWRLPSQSELLSIINFEKVTAAVDVAYFPNTQGEVSSFGYYWSSTSSYIMNYYGQAKYVSFHQGTTGYDKKSNDNHIRLIRSNKPVYLADVNNCSNPIANMEMRKPNSIYMDPRDGTVIDTETGLMWQKCALGMSYNTLTNSCDDSPQAFTWQVALNAANDNKLYNYEDWRIPNIKEVSSLFEPACYDPAINESIFPDFPGSFISSTPYMTLTPYIWSGSFFRGDISYTAKNDPNKNHSVFLVRDVQ